MKRPVRSGDPLLSRKQTCYEVHINKRQLMSLMFKNNWKMWVLRFAFSSSLMSSASLSRCTCRSVCSASSLSSSTSSCSAFSRESERGDSTFFCANDMCLINKFLSVVFGQNEYNLTSEMWVLEWNVRFCIWYLILM